VLVEIAQ
jgi:hypothetical protein